MPKQGEPERCNTCGKPILKHTKDQAVDCGKIGYWTYLINKTDGRRAEA